MCRVLNFIEQHSSKFLWLMVILYSSFFSALSIWKYNHFLYNGLDLAIINNVFYNTLHGHWFWSSIQGHSYLGDHFTPILIFLLPFYALWQSPEILLILQSLFLALAAWPIYKISQLLLKDKTLSLAMALLWLVNPLVHNANLFEFHFISLLPFLFLSLFYCYLKIKTNPYKKLFLCFYVLMLLCLLIREDVAFIILTFLILAGLENFKNYNLRKILFLVFLAVLIWLLGFFAVINHFSPSGVSPFVYYYSWISSAGWLNFVWHIFSVGNLKMLIGFLLPFLFIPLIKPKWLLVSLIPLGQILLSAAGGGPLVWKLHYGLLFMPALVIAFVYSFKKANHLLTQQFKNRFLLIIILIVSNFYLWIDLGPLTLNLNQFNFSSPSVKQLVKSIPPSAVVLSSYEFLPHFSSRQDVYALNYYFLGQQQFGSQAYILTEKPEYILIDFQDLISFQLQFSQLDWTKNIYRSGAQRLARLLQAYKLVEINGQTALFKRSQLGNFELYHLSINQVPSGSLLDFNAQIKLANFKLITQPTRQPQLNLGFYVLQPPAKDYQLKLEILSAAEEYQKYLPLAYGLYPSRLWQPNQLVQTTYWLSLPPSFNLSQAGKIKLSLVELKSFLFLDKLGVVKLKIDREKTIGQPVSLEIKDLIN